MNLRQAVQGQFGSKVVELLDAYAEIHWQESCDYDIGRKDRRGLHEGQLLGIKQQIIDLKGPVATVRIAVASTADWKLLASKVDDFHDVDDVLEKEFKHNLGVILDSESGEMFVFATPAMAPAVKAALETAYPDVRWTTIEQPLDLSSLRVVGSWPASRDWLKLKHGNEEG